ncbi:MAG: cellulase family glycosylhydrolase, partial [Planctomycetota bacterium]|nr:cellulase family glycosylhydrolase [Planctomycetota bacterium]
LVEPTPFQGTNVPNSKFHLESQLRALERKNIVYAPHMYTGGAWNGELTRIDVNAEDLQRDIDGMLRTARDLSVPLWIGEHGVSSTAAGSAEWARAVTDKLDANAVGAAWWVYWADDTFGLLSPDKSEKNGVVDLVARPYPRRALGRIGAFSFDPESKRFVASVARTSEETFWIELAVPARHYRDGFSLSIRTVPGGKETSLGRFEAKTPTARTVEEVADCAWSGSTGACGILKISLAPSGGQECALTLMPIEKSEED